MAKEVYMRSKSYVSVYPLPVTLLLLFSTGCCSPVGVAEKETSKLQHFPGATLVYQYSEVTGGSDERCVGAWVDRLYGTDHPLEEVVSFYSQTLPSDWRKDERFLNPTWVSPNKVLLFLIISSHVKNEAPEIPEHLIDSAMQTYRTVYIVRLSYSEGGRCRGF
jgi:hypothetical protein